MVTSINPSTQTSLEPRGVFLVSEEHHQSISHIVLLLQESGLVNDHGADASLSELSAEEGVTKGSTFRSLTITGWREQHI